jgi:5-methylcytosine-specific restriction endonuclease McrA
MESREGILKNKNYIKYLSNNDHQCVMCGATGWDDNQIIAHHAISIPGLQLGGMGTKASDTLAMPMHVICHHKFHTEFHHFKEEQPIWLIKWLEKMLRIALAQEGQKFF